MCTKKLRRAAWQHAEGKVHTPGACGHVRDTCMVCRWRRSPALERPAGGAGHLGRQVLGPLAAPQLLDGEPQAERRQRAAALEVVLVEEVLHGQRCGAAGPISNYILFCLSETWKLFF